MAEVAEGTAAEASGSVRASRAVKISVIVPIYNAEPYLAECLESALTQSLADLEVLAIDDGSSDGSTAIVEEYQQRDPRLRLLRHPGGENRGVSRSRELGLAHAHGEYVAFLDADDVFKKSKLERQVAELDRRPQCVLCHTGIVVFREKDTTEDGGPGGGILQDAGHTLYDRLTERHCRMKRSKISEYQLFDRQDAFSRNYICNSSVMVRKSTLAGLRLGFEQLYQVEDWALWLRLAQRGPFLLLPEPLVTWRRHAGQATRRTERDRLKVAYARLELLLCLLATSEDPQVRGPVQAALPDALQDAVGCYAEGADPPWEAEAIELASLSPSQFRRRRFRKRLVKWRQTLFGR